jgi:hypothetical protein
MHIQRLLIAFNPRPKLNSFVDAIKFIKNTKTPTPKTLHILVRTLSINRHIKLQSILSLPTNILSTTSSYTIPRVGY